MKLCKDCANARMVGKTIAWCAAPENGYDVITGGFVVRNCRTSRTDGTYGACGLDAEFFVQRKQSFFERILNVLKG